MKQINYQLLYRLKKPKGINGYKKYFDPNRINFLEFRYHPPVYKSYLGDNKFTFLNIEHDFEKEIDWNYHSNGKLWNYNLQYANYILQKEIPIVERIRLLRFLYKSISLGKLPLEPYPVSLRVINTFHLFSKEKLKNSEVLENVYGELQFLSERLEFHLLGNHLLENAFALMMGGAFFCKQEWLDQGKLILLEQLEEQILNDGAHFELSPMYHKIILFRMLELIDWYSKYQSQKKDFLDLLVQKAKIMCSWLEEISFRNGDIPHFNDSAEGIAYSSKILFNYAKVLNISWEKIPFGESGYRSFNNDSYECRIDFGQIGASYQPAHAHADAFGFILYRHEKPVFVEQGTSTYNIGERRNLERSTSAHNTIVVNNQNQSEVWAGFRVGRRAKTFITKDSKNMIEAFHSGYKRLGIKHSRSFQFLDEQIIIEDFLSNNAEGIFHLHLHPNSIVIGKTSTTFVIDREIEIEFKNCQKVDIREYLFADGYNNYKNAKRFVVVFRANLMTSILFKSMQ